MSIQDNLVFVMNVVDYLAGDKELIALRSREITSSRLKRWRTQPKEIEI